MAQPAFDFFTSRGLAVKAEVTEGTDPTGTSALNSFDIMNGKSGTEFDKVERKRDRVFFTGDPFVVANKRAFIEGEIELIPPTVPGAAGATGTAPCEVVLLPCGMSRAVSLVTNTTTLTPISRAVPSVFCYWWHSGTYLEVAAARGNVNGLKMEIGSRFMANIRLQGTYVEKEEATVPTDFDYSDFTAPLVAEYNNSTMIVNVDDSAGATVGTADLHLWGKMLSVDFGNQLNTKQYTEKKTTAISDRKATWTARFARPAKADFDVYAARDAGHTVMIAFKTTDAVTGLYSQLYIRGQIEQIQDTDIEGDFGYEISGPCIASDAGNDEFSIVFGDATP